MKTFDIFFRIATPIYVDCPIAFKIFVNLFEMSELKTAFLPVGTKRVLAYLSVYVCLCKRKELYIK